MPASRASRASRVLLLAVALVIAWPTSAGAAPTLPNSMSVAGDSIARAFNTCWFPYIDCVANSWATGSSTTVNSHYRRILAGNKTISGRAYNDAKSGAKMADLPGQMAKISSRNVQYVAVDMGGNDVCTPSVATMTSVAAFTDSLRSGLAAITANPNVQTVYVTSIPDAYRLWELFRTSSSARSTWSRFSVCQSLLANPTSTDPVDAARRQQVRDHNVALNSAIESVCAEFAGKCVFDGWAIFCTAFASSDITSRDYFHPSTSGQKKYADVSWRAGPFVATPTPYLGADCTA
jgi:GDSL-like Lipase/Acylhydrolase family